MRELLVRYLLGELNAGERAELEKQLRDSSELRSELAHLQDCFAASRESDLDAPEPPRGLAERTSERVAGFAAVDQFSDNGANLFDFSSGRVAAFAGAHDQPSGPLGWSFADVTVAAGVCLAMCMLLVPALRDSRDLSRLNYCQNNLRELNCVLGPYRECHTGKLPPVYANEPAGMFIVRLVNEGYLERTEASRMLVCRNSPLASEIGHGRAQVVIPDELDVKDVSPAALGPQFATVTGSYAVRVGFLSADTYRLDSDADGDMPIVADGPDFNVAGPESTNHRGGLNVLLVSGCVKFLPSALLTTWHDHIFTNAEGQPAAGCNRHDAVLMPGYLTPNVKMIGKPE